MRVVAIDDAPVWTDGERYSMPNPMNRFYEQLACELGEVVVCGPTSRVSADVVNRGHIADPGLVRFASRPYYESPMDFLARGVLLIVPTVWALWQAVRSADVVYLRLPSVVGLMAYGMTVVRGRPRIVQIKGSWHASVGDRFLGAMKALGKALVKVFAMGDYFIARRSTTLVHTDDHYRRANTGKNRVHMAIVSLVSQGDIRGREDTCQETPVKLLFVGRVSPAKGLEYVMRALSEMDEPRPTLRIVGTGPELSRLHQLADGLSLDSLVSFEGNLGHGDSLMEVYRTSDVFILPSVTEGIPKVIFEAMASGIPIIATEVGGIPHVIQHEVNGLLIAPRSVRHIKDAVSRLVSDASLRKGIISKGYETVSHYTLESTAKSVAGIIRSEVKEAGGM